MQYNAVSKVHTGAGRGAQGLKASSLEGGSHPWVEGCWSLCCDDGDHNTWVDVSQIPRALLAAFTAGAECAPCLPSHQCTLPLAVDSVKVASPPFSVWTFAQAGEFWWKLALQATPALPQPPIELSAPLGSCATHLLSVANPTAVEANFTSSSTSPTRFWLTPEAIRVGLLRIKLR